MKIRPFVALFLSALLAAACDQVAQEPIAFPNRAYLGETISVAIGSDHPQMSTNTFTLSTENLRIQLWDQATDATLDLALRALVTGSSSLGTTSAGTEQRRSRSPSSISFASDCGPHPLRAHTIGLHGAPVAFPAGTPLATRPLSSARNPSVGRFLHRL